MAYNWATGLNAPPSYNWATGQRLPQAKQSLKVPEPINSRAEDYRAPGNNRSPAGETIPAGAGASSYDGKIVFFSGVAGAEGGNNDWVQAINAYLGESAAGARATFVMLFADCLFTSSFALLWLYADEQLIVSNVAPTRQSGETIRFYDGTQTAPDPVLVAALGADKASAWTGFCYAVFQDFDCSIYGDRVPLIRAVLAGAVTDVAPSEEQSTLTFGSFGVGYANTAMAADPVRGWHYQIVSNGNNDAYVVTVDIDSLVEINRVAVSGEANFGLIKSPLALGGTDFVVCTLTAPNDRIALLNTQTGLIVETLEALGGYNLSVNRVTLLRSDSATKFIGTTEYNSGATLPLSTAILGVFVVDVTNGTLAYIVHPSTAPAVGYATSSGGVIGLGVEFGTIVDGVQTIYYPVETVDGKGAVNVALVSGSSFTSGTFYTETEAGKTPRGLAYDMSRNVLVLYRSDGSFVKLNGTTGAVISTSSGAITNFNINYWASDFWGSGTSGEYKTFHHSTRPGYAVATRGTNNGDIYEINLQTLVATELIDESDFSNDDLSKFWDQTSGVMTEGSDTAGIINRVTLGGKTPAAVDLEDLFTQVATVDGRFEAADLTVTDFPGGECGGFKLENDTTVDNLENAIAEAFDVKIVPSDGKRKYLWPKRDGSFAVDHELAVADLVEIGPRTVEKVIDAGEEELAGIDFGYFDQDAGYRRLTQPFDRPLGVFDVTPSLKRRTTPALLSMTASQAQRAAQLAVFRSVLGNEQEAFGLVQRQAHVEPGDIVGIPFRGFRVVARIEEARIEADFTQECLAHQYLQYAEAPFAGAQLERPEELSISLSTRMIYLDTPLLSYADDLGGAGLVQYAQVAGYGPGIVSGSVYKSSAGTTYTNQGTRSGILPLAGVVTAISGTPVDPFAKDETNSISVLVSAGDIGDLATIGVAEFEAGANLAAIGRPGRWVLLWFQTVSASDGIATLSDLMWGVRGSEVWIGELAPGDMFVLLRPEHYTRFRNEVADLDDTFLYKVAHPSVPLAAVPTHAFAAGGVAETPYAPVNLFAVVAGSDIELSWDFRSRLAAGLNPADHGEAALSFEVDVMDGGSPGSVLRTLTATTNARTYAAADIATDFGSMPDYITFRVHMMSAIVGRGYAGEATIYIGAPLTADIDTVTADSTFETADIG